jgi:hypothetical protein
VTVIARFPMVCRECQRPIESGDVIEKRELVWSDLDRPQWVHADCTHTPSDTERKRAYMALNKRMRRRARKGKP